MLIRGQLGSDSPLIVPLEVPAQRLEARQTIFLHKRCLDRFSEHVLPKFKLDTSGFEPLKRRVKELALAHDNHCSLRRLAGAVRWCVMMYLPVISTFYKYGAMCDSFLTWMCGLGKASSPYLCQERMITCSKGESKAIWETLPAWGVGFQCSPWRGSRRRRVVVGKSTVEACLASMTSLTRPTALVCQQGGTLLLSVWLVGQKDVRIGAGVDRTCLKNPTKLISEPEFWERFHILNGISIHLVDGALTSIEKGSPNVIFLARNNLTQAPPSLSFVFQTIPPLYQNSSGFHSSECCQGANGMQHPDMLFQLDLFLLEVLFVYTIKISRKGIFSLSAQISSLQLVIGLLDSNKGKEMRGRLVEWVEKVSFDHLNKLFVIYAVKMNHQTLLMNQNLLAVVQEPQPYVLLVIPRLFPKGEEEARWEVKASPGWKPSGHYFHHLSHPSSSAKKKSTAKATKKAPAPAPVSSSVSTSFTSAFAASIVPDSKANLNFLGAKPDIEVELVVPLALPPAKRYHVEDPHVERISDTPTAPMPYADIVGPSSAPSLGPSVRKEVYPE
ncbi:hypothetical protein CK203_016852 [Vitis vinifera]|uniref:Uncharacterized protein n=1 Tax=Vitis vinifera TaxID=29760 RepID=A0A438JNE8_VITVI|nr:hypothetical protein CK203_016852 [Vitis vinifera]